PHVDGLARGPTEPSRARENARRRQPHGDRPERLMRLYGSFPERIHNAPELSGRRASGIEFHTIMHTFHVTRPAHIAKPGQAAPRHLLGRPSPHVPASPPHAAMCWAMPR